MMEQCSFLYILDSLDLSLLKSRKEQAIPQCYHIKPPSELRSHKMKFLAKTHPNLACGNKM